MVKSTRRTPSSTPRTQATLSFKTPLSGKISKPNAVTDTKKKTISSPALAKIETKNASQTSSVNVSPVSVKSFESEVATPVREPTREEIEARSVDDKEIGDYYHNKVLGPRKVKPVHQDDLSVNEKVLRHFDMSSEYGPFIGLSRLDRWKRAHDLELEPPLEVLAVILKAEDANGKLDGKTRDERIAYIDEFLRGGGDVATA